MDDHTKRIDELIEALGKSMKENNEALGLKCVMGLIALALKDLHLLAHSTQRIAEKQNDK